MGMVQMKGFTRVVLYNNKGTHNNASHCFICGRTTNLLKLQAIACELTKQTKQQRHA
jgi:hypothetical protein